MRTKGDLQWSLIKRIMKDEKTYEVLKTDPTPKYKRKLISILSKLKKEEKIYEKQYRLLYPTTGNTPRLYCTTKIHKKDNPVRPIVDYTDSLGYETSRALADLLNPLIGNTKHHVKKMVNGKWTHGTRTKGIQKIQCGRCHEAP